MNNEAVSGVVGEMLMISLVLLSECGGGGYTNHSVP